MLREDLIVAYSYFSGSCKDDNFFLGSLEMVYQRAITTNCSLGGSVWDIWELEEYFFMGK